MDDLEKSESHHKRTIIALMCLMFDNKKQSSTTISNIQNCITCEESTCKCTVVHEDEDEHDEHVDEKGNGADMSSCHPFLPNCSTNINGYFLCIVFQSLQEKKYRKKLKQSNKRSD